MADARRLPPFVAPVAVAIAALAWLAWPGGDPAAPWSSMDAAYHLLRASRCLLDFPLVASTDSYSHAGTTWHLPWPGALALLHATIARLAGAEGGDPLALAPHLSLLAPGLGAAAAAVIVLLARTLGLREAPAVLAGLACAVSGDALLVFHRGVVDHRSFTALLLPLAVLAWLRRSLGGWTLATLLLALLDPGAALHVALMLGLFITCEGWAAAAASRERLPRPGAFFLAPAVALAAGFVIDRALDPTPPPLLSVSPFRLSLFQVAGVALLGLAGVGAAVLPRRGRSRGERFSALGGVVLGAVAVLVLALLLTRQLGSLLDRLAGWPGAELGDRVSPLRLLAQMPGTHWGAWAVLLLLVALGAFGRTMLAIQRRESPREVESAALLLGSVALAFVSLGHSRSLAPLVALALVVAARDAVHVLGHGRGGRSPVRAVAVAWLALLVVPPLAWHSAELRRVLRDPPAWREGVGPLAAWAREALPPAGPRDERPARAVLAPWEWGHHLNAFGNQPVLVDGFNREEQSAGAAGDAWLEETGDGFAEAALRLGATHVGIAGGETGIVATLPRGRPETALPDAARPGHVAWLPSLRRHAIFRLEEAGGLSDESGRLMPLWSTTQLRPLVILDGDQAKTVHVPLARLFEITPGAEVSGTAPPATVLLTVRTSLRIGADTQVAIVRRIPVDASGRFRFRTAIPAPFVSGPIVVEGPHHLGAYAGESLLMLSADAVRTGASVSIPPESFIPAPPAGGPAVPPVP